MTDTRPIVKCEVRACPMIGRFSDGLCPYHALPHTDKPIGRTPTWDEAADAEGGGPIATS